MNSKLDNINIGLVLGILAPFLTMVVIYFIEFNNFKLHELVDLLVSKHVMTKIVSLCVIPNLALFFIFLNKNFYKAARGVLMATIIFAIFVFVTKFAL